MSASRPTFTAGSRLLHWVMAALIIAMLFIGAGMAATVSRCYPVLVSLHRPIGIVILVLVVVRFLNRLMHPPPPLPRDLPAWQRLAAKGSHYVLYGLMFLMPLIGWAMMSAAPYPVVLFGALRLPPIMPPSASFYALLRPAHAYLAYLFFATLLGHLGAALFHGLVRRDGVLQSMVSVRNEVGDGT
jgi:cytochrome b561